MKKKHILLQNLLIIISFGASLSAMAQPTKVVYPHQGFWTKSEITEIFPNKWGVGVDFIYRSISDNESDSMFKRWHRFSVRPWVHYQVNENVRFSLNPVSYFATQEYVGKEDDLLTNPYNELRTTFQVLHHHKQMDGKITHTFRHWYEIRYRNPFEENDFTFTRYRIRYRIRYLLNKDYYSENGVVYAYATNEVMVNYGQRIVYNMFSQNRVQVAVGYRFLNSIRAEVRYINRFRSRATGFEYDNNQGLFLGLFIDQVSRIGGKNIRPVRFFD